MFRRGILFYGGRAHLNSGHGRFHYLVRFVRVKPEGRSLRPRRYFEEGADREAVQLVQRRRTDDVCEVLSDELVA